MSEIVIIDPDTGTTSRIAYTSPLAPDSLPSTIKPIQLRLALLTASEPADSDDPDGPAVIPWAKGMDLMVDVENFMASLPPKQRRLMETKFEYAVSINAAEFMEQAMHMGFTAGQANELIAYAASLND